jgi:response regulator of citrate/malate metabolism
VISTFIVDDDFMVARVHAGFVAALAGFEVVGRAHTGQDALDEIERLRPDLVLLDVYLPDMTGLDVLGRLRALGTDVDVIVISAARDLASLQRARHGGVLHYLVKPFDRRTFEARLLDYAQLRADIDQVGEVAQSHADRLFSAGRPPDRPAARTPKGISPETFQLVRRALAAAGAAGLSATECGEATGLGRVSARRYLEQLVSDQEADVRQRYGTAGRPERRFTLRSAVPGGGGPPPGARNVRNDL